MDAQVHFVHPSVPALHRRIDREISHTLAVVLFTHGDGYGFGVVNGEGQCLAWDGIYYDAKVPETTPLDQLDWDNWDDMSSKLVFNTQAPWLAGPLGFWLMPTYSVAREAAELVHLWAESPKDDNRDLHRSTIRCYLPVADHDAYETHLQAWLA